MAGMAGGVAAPAARMAAGRVWRNVDLARVTLADGGDGFKRSWIMLMPEGEFEHPQYGALEFTHAKLADFKKNFDGRVRKIDIALDQDHDGGKATGWLEKLELRDGGLWGLVRWTKLGEQLLTDQIYRYFSPEFGNFTDPESGKKFSNVIIGGALTNRPFLKSMPAVKLKDRQRFQRPGQYTKADRAKIAPEDFAGPGQTFPIVTQQDVHDAARLIGHAANPAAVKARVIAIARRKGFALPDAWTGETGGGGEAQAQKAGEAGMATRKSRKLAEEEEAEQPAGEQEQLDQADEAEDEEDALEDEEDEGDELDEDEEDEADEGAELAEKPSGKGKPFAGAAKPFGKGGKKPAADDAEDEADGGADEDAEEMDDGSVDEEYDDTTGDDEEETPAPPARKRGGQSADKGKAMKAGTSRKMTEPQMLSEIARLTEENRALREEQFKASVNRTLSEFTRDIRSEADDDEFALPRAFKLAYREYMFGEGVKLSEESVSGLNELVKLALRVGTVPLTSLASQVERGRVADADDRRPRVSANDPDMTPEAERVALSDYKRPLSQLSMEERENIYFGLEERRKGKRGSVA